MNIRGIVVGLVGLGIIVLLFVLIIKAFTGHKTTPIPQSNLSSYASTNAVAELYIDAPINVDQDHRTVRISVSRAQTQIDIIQGYQGNILTSQTYENNEPGYAVFLQALKHLNFAKGNSDPALRDERGYCPQGNRFIYQLNSGGSNVFRYWSTSCGGQGTFGGSALRVRELFERQIPNADFFKLTGSIPLG